jgi:beta-lactamase superfamily II metal-dependent hydrolase
MKQVVFNVGGALSTYIEFDGNTLLVDVGKSDYFNPITDFLLPLYKKRNSKRYANSTKYYIDQLIISHPHNDHISAIEDFSKNFYPELLTCPNDNFGMEEFHKINWDLVDDNENVKILRQMLIGRTPPLTTTNTQNEFIYYIPPKSVERNNDLTNESYCNNISIAVYVKANGSRILMPGDLQKLGMQYLINTDALFYNILREGVDVLITPHHGLRSSFSTVMFDTMKNKKTRCLNIVSEKSTTTDSTRQIDTRYSTNEYCKGENNLLPSPVYQRKTSNGHIYIDYSSFSSPQFEIITDTDILINKFLTTRVFRYG